MEKTSSYSNLMVQDTYITEKVELISEDMF